MVSEAAPQHGADHRGLQAVFGNLGRLGRLHKQIRNDLEQASATMRQSNNRLSNNRLSLTRADVARRQIAGCGIPEPIALAAMRDLLSEGALPDAPGDAGQTVALAYPITRTSELAELGRDNRVLDWAAAPVTPRSSRRAAPAPNLWRGHTKPYR